MSRIQKYQSSIKRFITNKSTLYKDISETNNLDQELNIKIKKKINDFIDSSDLILAIFFLTIMSSQNKNNNISIQGFYASSGIEYLLWLNKYLSDEKQMDPTLSNVFIFILSSNIYKSIEVNLETLERSIDKTKYTKINSKIKKLLNNKIRISYLNFDNIKKVDFEKKKSDIYRYLIKKHDNLYDSYSKIKLINKEDYLNILNKDIIYVSELSSMLGWLFGSGELKQCDMAQKCGKYFGLLYKISTDYVHLLDDIIKASENKNKISLNYIINIGLQKSYEDYMEYKQQFITCCLLLDTYTGTIKEIIEVFDNNVDRGIDITSPDLKTSSSNNHNSIETI
jgi:hypothetical protein